MTPKRCTVALILFWLAPSSRSEQLPIRTYTTEHGLPSNSTFRILQGSRGHLWFATRDGVSRFDGHEIENYGAPKGLLENWITDIMETRAGVFWIGTRSRGVCRFDATILQPLNSSSNGSFGNDPLYSSRLRWSLRSPPFRYAGFAWLNAVELEHIRIRIAADLHDDIGSTWSQIALLSKVVRHNMNGNEKGAEPVTRIGKLSRELTDSMSDLVWAINPRRDSFSELTHRMRRFGNDMLRARDIDFAFHAFGFDNKTKLTADVRQQVYLIFKEIIHNVVKHVGCRHVRVEFGVVCVLRPLCIASCFVGDVCSSLILVAGSFR